MPSVHLTPFVPLGAAFGPVLLLSLWTDLLTGRGAIAGMVTGFAVTVAWKTSGLSDRVIYELVPAFLLAGVAALAASWLDRRVSGREGPSPASASSSAGG
jgi:Na+/proline symporter